MEEANQTTSPPKNAKKYTGWPMWVVYRYQQHKPYKVGTSKDDLIDWLMMGYNDDLYAWGYTRADAIVEAEGKFAEDL